MNTTREGNVHRGPSAIGIAASVIERCVRLNAEPSKPLAPKKQVKIGAVAPASDIYAYALDAEENTRFLHLVTACAQIKTHYELFLLVQGELQYFLPHDVLIAAWGDFSTQTLRFDVVSNLPEVRTSRLCKVVVPLAKRLHKMWDEGRYQPVLLNKSVAELEACNGDPCLVPCALHDMRLSLVHGTRNRRDGYDSLYIALRRQPVAIDAADARLRCLADAVIHQIDIAYRNVSALHAVEAVADKAMPTSLLSVREEEITYWVCLGKTNGQIAQTLGISVNTVKNHVHRIFDKLGANNRAHAALKYRDIAGTAESNFSGGNQ